LDFSLVCIRFWETSRWFGATSRGIRRDFWHRLPLDIADTALLIRLGEIPQNICTTFIRNSELSWTTNDSSTSPAKSQLAMNKNSGKK
jgi:hypothetical protein